MIFKFNSILRSLHETLTTTEDYEKDLLKELERFSIEPSNHDHSSRQQIVFLRNEMQINQYQTLLNYIEKMKTLLNKLETIKDRNPQYYFLYSQLDRFYEILRNHYQIELPAETNIESIRLSLNNIRRRTRKQLDEYERKRTDLQRRLDVLKKKEELKQRTKTTFINEVYYIDLFVSIELVCFVPGWNIEFTQCLYSTITNGTHWHSSSILCDENSTDYE